MRRFDPFAAAGPRWFAIPAHRPFLEDLAAGVLDWLGDSAPETLSDATILVPNRRAARAFTGALARLSGERPVLLPQVRPLGDLEEDEPPFTPGALGLDLPPAIAPLTRRFEMARMIVEKFEPGARPLKALEMADALGGFLDSCQLEAVEDPGRVATLVEGDLADHWRQSAAFLALAVEEWPKRLAAMGLVDPAWRRTTLLRRLAEAWDAEPPTGPVIAAGSTGSVKAAADVLKAVANAPLGCVVLPGLDRDLAGPAWDQIDEPHPQSALKRLLDRHGVARAAVADWPCPLDEAAQRPGRARQRLINEALRPAEATDDWRKEIIRLREGADADPIAEGLRGLSLLTLRAEEDTAAAIALMMRETLETPGKTCALVTPDLNLSRRVAARLERWGVAADSSTGEALIRMPVGALVDLAARLMAERVKPQTLLAVLKHPLVHLGLPGEVGRDGRIALEESALRGPRPRDFAMIRNRLVEAAGPDRRGRPLPEWKQARLPHAQSLTDRIEAALATALADFTPAASLETAAAALTGLVETLAGVDVWAGPDGEAAATLLSGLIDGGAALGPIDPADFAELMRGLLKDETVRTGGATHARLRILGAIEARLARADRMILAGLEEGVWPGAAPVDPFLSRPMRAALGLPPPERRLGQTAQDFVQAACAEEAVLVHSERRGGQPAVKSRWLWRLEMLTRGAHSDARPVTIDRPAAGDWARALDAPSGLPNYAPRPRPTPPVRLRPRSLYVTRIERWVRDPYAIYAQWVLGLEPMDRPGASAEAIARGNAVHKAIELMTVAWPNALPDDCEDQIHDLLVEQLGHAGFEDAAMARERPLARNCARWLTAFEQGRRARGLDLLVEQKGEMGFDAPGGRFSLKAKADRIEIDAHGGAVIDFKTGQAPSKAQVKSGFSPQLTLTGAILAAGGFRKAGPVEPVELAYVRVVGRKKAGEIVVVAEAAEAADLAQAALDGLKRRVARFDEVETPYVSWAASQFMGGFGGDYDHLARVWEWHVVGADGEEASGE